MSTKNLIRKASTQILEASNRTADLIRIQRKKCEGVRELMEDQTFYYQLSLAISVTASLLLLIILMCQQSYYRNKVNRV